MLRLHAGMHKWDVEESEECHCPIPVPLYCNLDLFCAFCCWFWVPCLKAELVKLWTLWVPLHSARKVNLTSRRFKRRWFHGQSCDAGFGMANHDELGIALYIYILYMDPRMTPSKCFFNTFCKGSSVSGFILPYVAWVNDDAKLYNVIYLIYIIIHLIALIKWLLPQERRTWIWYFAPWILLTLNRPCRCYELGRRLASP